MFSPFKYVKCLIDLRGNKVITWAFNKGLQYTKSFQLYVQYSPNNVQWYTISQDVSQDFYYVDTRHTTYNKVDEGSYRLKLTLDNLDQVYISQPCGAGTRLAYPHHPRARNLLRLAAKQMNLTGLHGTLYKRKYLGQKCPDCTDFNNDSSVNQHCSVCLGTGIVGGYYQGIAFNILPDQKQQVIAQLDSGLAHNITLQARCIAWPYIKHDDVWVQNQTNNRYCIDQIKIASSYMHTPLTYILSMHLLQKTDAAYDKKPCVKQNKKKPQIKSLNIDWLQDFKV